MFGNVNVPVRLGVTGNAVGVEVSGSMVIDDPNLSRVAVLELVMSNPVSEVSVLLRIGFDNITRSFRESASGSANAKGVINACNLLMVSESLCPLRTKLDTSLIVYTHPKTSLSFEPPMLMNLLPSLFPLCLPLPLILS